MDAHLGAMLQFSAPVANQITSWPAHQAEMHRKLKKTQKALPAFGWDTEPIMGREVSEETWFDALEDLIPAEDLVVSLLCFVGQVLELAEDESDLVA